MKRLVIGLFALMFATGCSDEPEAPGTVWRFAIEETRGSVQDAYAQAFRERIEEATEGEVSVVVYPYGTLGTSDHITEQIHNGTLDLAMASPGHLGKLIPEVQVFLLHFVLSDDPRANALALSDPEVRATLDALYRDKGLAFLTALGEGWQVWTARQPLRTLEDFRGLRIRVMTSPLLVRGYRAYGANPTPMPYSEVYSGLQLRMIDAQVNPIFAIEEMSFYEVNEVLTSARQAPFVTTLMASPAFLADLSPERRRLLEETVDALQLEITHIERRYNEERLQRMRERRPSLRFIELEPEERARFAARAAPVREVFIELAGPRGAELLEALEAAVARAEAELADDGGRAPRESEP